MILNMNQLRAFYTAAKQNSITKAAEVLMVTPPAISKQVRQLEETIGMKLLYRSGNTIELTDIGRDVFRESEAVFEKITDMENYLEDISIGKLGELRIGCPQTPAKYIMPRLIARFKETHPGIRIIVDQGTNMEMVRNLLTSRNELALIRNRPDDRRLKMKVLRNEEILLLAAPHSRHLPGREISVTLLDRLPLILPKEGSAVRDVTLEYLQRYKISPNVVMESGSIGLVKELIRQDTGLCFLERYAVAEDLARERLTAVTILEGSPKVEFGIGYFHKKHLSPAAWAFLRLLDKLDDIVPTVSF